MLGLGLTISGLLLVLIFLQLSLIGIGKMNMDETKRVGDLLEKMIEEKE